MAVKLIPGRNDLATVNPALAAQWDYESNGDLKPTMVSAGSSKKVGWVCEQGHHWPATIASRNAGAGCPDCAREAGPRKLRDSLLASRGSLADKNPDLAAEWHPTKNGEITPSDIRPMSNRKYWWVCSKCGHEWMASANSRIHLKSGCPACVGRVPNIGENDLFTACPHLKDEWDFELNKNIDLSKTPKGSHLRVWWKCSKCGHKWQASIAKRAKGSKCPCCVNRVVKRGYNDLATTHPNVAIDWNVERNGSLTPEMIAAGSNKKVWWKCHKCGCEWETSPNKRTVKKNPTGCPICGIEKSTEAKVKSVSMIDPKTNKIIKTYASIVDASRETHIGSGHISKVCQYKGNTAGGYIWRYADENEDNKYQKNKKQLDFDFE